MRDKEASLILKQSRIPVVAAARTGAEVGSAARSLANALELVLIGGMWLLLPFWPLAVAAVSSERGCVRHYGATLRRIVRHIRAQHRSRSIGRMLEHRFTRSDRRDAEAPSGACSHCGRCCLNRHCIFLAFDGQGQSICRIYGGRLWRMLSCGNYPRDAQDIALYDCPSFRVVRGLGRQAPGRLLAGGSEMMRALRSKVQ